MRRVNHEIRCFSGDFVLFMVKWGIMNIAFISSEVVPFAKTGGLADVAGSLPKFLSRQGAEVKVFMPFYRDVKKKGFPVTKVIDKKTVDWQGKKEFFSVWEYTEDALSFLFIENDSYYDRDSLYGTSSGDFPDNGERFAFFSRASLETCKKIEFQPALFHCHDWQAAIVLAYLKFLYAGDTFFQASRSLCTIHNLAYQGLFGRDILGRIGLPDSLFNMEELEFHGKVNYLKAGILYSSAVSTVSPRYSKEIQTPEFGHGLDGLLRKQSDSLVGILNGVDYSAWNPSSDKFIIKNYDQENTAGKKECREDILAQFQLLGADENIPVVGMVTRLAGQKGLDILSEALEDIFRIPIYLVILGTGEEKFQNILLTAQKKHPKHFGLKIAFDEALSHKIMAGSDIFLIPSRYEPCGLTQMYSLRYGTIPVVRATGGLDDTIQEFSPQGGGNGFKFQEYSSGTLVASLEKAVKCFREKKTWSGLVRNAMTYDFSWDKSAREYLNLYKAILSK